MTFWLKMNKVNARINAPKILLDGCHLFKGVSARKKLISSNFVEKQANVQGKSMRWQGNIIIKDWMSKKKTTLNLVYMIERFSYDLEMKMREQNKNNKWTEIEWFDLFIEPDTNSRGFWLVERTLGWKNVMPENFLEIKRYFALTSYCNTIGQSNNSFCLLGFSLAGKRKVHVSIFSSIG